MQILGGIESVDADVVVSDTQSQEPVDDSVEIDFPEDSAHNEFASKDVTWSYNTFDYHADSGTYTVDRADIAHPNAPASMELNLSNGYVP